jgi:putative ABC transport system permease protein
VPPRRHRLGFVFTALLLAVGVSTFVGLRTAQQDLSRSLDRFYQHRHFADLTVVGGRAHAFADEARAVPGVDAVNLRHTTTLSVFLHDGHTKVQGTIIGVPASGPAIDVPLVTMGTAFARSTTEPVAIVDQHTAEDLDLRPGDTVEALGVGAQDGLRVTGVGLSPEYVLPAQSQQQVVAAPGSFAVIFVPDVVARQLGGATAIPEVLVRYADGTSTDALDRRLTRIADAHDASLVEPRSHQPSNGLLAEVRTAIVEAALVVPALALVVATFVGALACARVSDRRRRRRMSVVATISGAVVGAVVGIAAARVASPLVTDAVHLPVNVSGVDGMALVVGVALALVTGPIAYALGTALVRALDDDTTLGVGPTFVTAIAAAAAVVCVVAPVGVVDSAQATLGAAARLERVDAQIAFVGRATGADIAALAAVPGVAAAEPVPSANVVVRHRDARYVTSLEAFRAGTSMQSFETPSGAPLPLPDHGALIPQSLGKILGAGPGDELEVTLPGAGVAPVRVPIAALTSDTLGNLVFLRIDTLRAALGADASSFAGGLFNTATIRFAPGADVAAIARQVQAMPGVVVYVPVAAALNSVAAARPTFRVITEALLAIGVVVMVLGLSAAVVLHARTRGRRGFVHLAVEVFGAVAVGIVVGALVGTFAADRLVHALDSELVHLTRDISGSTYLFAIGMVLLVSAVMLVVGAATLPRPDPEPTR